MIKRTVTAAVLIAILAMALTIGRGATIVFLLALNLGALMECFFLIEATGLKSWKQETAILTVTLYLLFLMSPPGRSPAILFTWFSLSAIILMLNSFRIRSNFLPALAPSMFVLFYVTGGLAFSILMLDMGEPGMFILLTLLFMVWALDTGGYIGGFLLGKRLFPEKMLAPGISPKKTIEGACTGVMATFVVAFIAWFLLQKVGTSPELKFFLGLAIHVSIFGQMGDLFESLLKREAGLKDSGTIFPGHGGILDRIDSLLFVFPTCYFYVTVSMIT